MVVVIVEHHIFDEHLLKHTCYQDKVLLIQDDFLHQHVAYVFDNHMHLLNFYYSKKRLMMKKKTKIFLYSDISQDCDRCIGNERFNIEPRKLGFNGDEVISGIKNN